MLDKEGNPESGAAVDEDAVHVKRKLETAEAEGERSEPVAEKSQAEVDKEEELGLITSTTYQLKKKICLSKFKSLNSVRMQCMASLTERFYLEKGFNYLNFNKFMLSVNGQSGAQGDQVGMGEEEIVDLNGVKITEKTNQVG